MTVRRLGDIILALTLVFICLPVLVLASAAVAIDLASAPLRRIERVTRDGRIVRLWRLRTTRDTPFGSKLTATGAVLHRVHLDQIPQLLNVLNGDLSFLAPQGAMHDAIDSKKTFVLRQQ